MVETWFLQEDLLAVLRWQLGNPGKADGPEIPYAGLRVWGLFLRLHEQRGVSMGPCPITYRDMVAFARISGEAIRPWEADIIRAMDREYLTIVNDREDESADVQSRPLSPALFDALF